MHSGYSFPSTDLLASFGPLNYHAQGSTAYMPYHNLPAHTQQSEPMYPTNIPPMVAQGGYNLPNVRPPLYSPEDLPSGTTYEYAPSLYNWNCYGGLL